MTDAEHSSGIVRAHVLVTGRVQGVYFRASTEAEARARGLAGWVRNRDDGAVEAVFEGPSGAVDSMIGWCRVGPSHARVDEVDVVWETPEGERGFGLRY
jgi:acylphosphatase